MTRTSSCYLLDILAEVPESTPQKRKTACFGIYPRLARHRFDVES